MPETMLLVPVRTSKQGTSLNAGKLKPEYQKITSTVEISLDDMERLELKAGDQIRLRARGREIVVSCQQQKPKSSTPGMMFIAYGPMSSELMDGDTAGTGMPPSKHIRVEIEGPI